MSPTTLVLVKKSVLLPTEEKLLPQREQQTEKQWSIGKLWGKSWSPEKAFDSSTFLLGVDFGTAVTIYSSQQQRTPRGISREDGSAARKVLDLGVQLQQR